MSVRKYKPLSWAICEKYDNPIEYDDIRVRQLGRTEK